MKLMASDIHHRNRHYIIKDDSSVGSYLYVYESDKCVQDFLQDDLQSAIEFANEEFHVPPEAWQTVQE